MTARQLLPLLACLATAHATDWPMYRGPKGDGSTPDKVTWPSTGPKQLWKVPSTNGFSSFVVGGGHCFTLEGRDIDGAQQEVLVARDANTGKEAWAATLGTPQTDGHEANAGVAGNDGGDGPRSTPAIAGGNVVTLSSKLVLQGFDAATGKPAWKIDLIADHAGKNVHWGNAASPILEGGLIYVAGGGPGQSLLAVDPKDGKVVAKSGDELITHATPIPATILGTRQIIYFLQSGLVAVEPKTLKELWRYAFQYKVSTAASPVVSGDIVYCSAGYDVGAGAAKITNAGGKWEAKEIYRLRGNKPVANHWSTPVLLGGHLYGMFSFKAYGNGPVKCVDIATGDVKWEQGGFGSGQAILAGDRVLALSDAGEIVIIDPKPDAYKEVGRAKLVEGKCWSTPIVSNGRLYVRSVKEAACFDLSGGTATR